MLEPQSLPSAARPSSESEYQPASGVAVTAIIVASIFILIVLGTAVTAVINKRPALNLTLLFLAGLAFILSIAARVHIRRSEGTRVGMQLANTAWWMSVLGGVGFGAYLFANVVALRQQSERAAADWFDLLKKREIDRAFVLTLPPRHRQSIDPNNVLEMESRYGAGSLPIFRNSELVRFFKRDGNDITIQSLGMSDWQQTDVGYRVSLSYQVKSPEGEFEINLSLTGEESDNFAGREWQISMPEGRLSTKWLTTYGWLVRQLESEARSYATEWVQGVQAKVDEIAVSGVLSANERPEIAAFFVARGFTNQMFPFLTTPAKWGRTIMLDGSTLIEFLAKRGFFKWDGSEPETLEKKELFRKVWDLGGLYPAGTTPLQNSETTPTISLSAERIECSFPLDVRLPGLPTSYARGRLILTCDSPELVREVQRLKADATRQDDYPAELIAKLPPRHWRVLRFECNLEPIQALTKPER